MKTPSPSNEGGRLEALKDYAIWQSPPERAFDDLVELAAHICQAPLALISLVGEDRQWFKSKVGLTLQETSRDVSFCAHAIQQPDLFIVADALADARFANNPLVTGEPHIRFYAGAPLITPEGHALGTLCVLDQQPRELSPEHQQALRVLSRHVMTQLDLRRLSRDLIQAREAKRCAEAARLEESQILERIRDAFVALDQDGRCVYVNQQAAQVLEIPAGELIGKNLFQLLAHGFGQALVAACTRAMAKQSPVRTEIENPITGCWYEARLYPSAAGITLFLQDVTQRKELEAELQGQTQKLREQARLLEGAHVLAFNMQRRIVFWNQGATDLYGWTAAEALGCNPNELLRTQFPQPVEEIMSELRQNGGWKGELTHTRRDGRTVVVASHWAVYRDARGQPEAILEVNNDITELKKAQEQLEEQTNALRALSARLQAIREEESTRIAREIHDVLGQLLTGVKLELRILETRAAALPGSPQAHALVEKCFAITRMVNAAGETVQKLSRELRPVILDTFGLTAALESEAKQFQERTGITCHWQPQAEKVSVSHEVATALYRVFQEIFTNIARHAQATAVQMSLRAEPGQVVLEVRDNGRGITAEATANPGALGLLGMRERAAMLGGQVVIDGSPGQGTAVQVTIPVDSIYDSQR